MQNDYKLWLKPRTKYFLTTCLWGYIKGLNFSQNHNMKIYSFQNFQDIKSKKL